MADFKLAFPKLSEHEGGYNNDPDDNGGETYRGVARKFFPKWTGWAIIDEAKIPYHPGFPETVSEILELNARLKGTSWTERLDPLIEQFYQFEFWSKMHGDDKQFPQEVAEPVFNLGVLFGLTRSVRWLQESLRLLGFGMVHVDGIVGSKVLAALDMNDHYGKSAELVADYKNRVRESAKNSKDFAKFGQGWLRRIDEALLNL